MQDHFMIGHPKPYLNPDPTAHKITIGEIQMQMEDWFIIGHPKP